MREILFRGKRVDNGEWVYGYYTELPVGTLGAALLSGADGLLAEDTAPYIINIYSKQHSNFSPAYPLEVVEAEEYEVIPETVGEFTGLTDRNGKKIFEGDICISVIETYTTRKEYVREVRQFVGAWGLATFDDAHFSPFVSMTEYVRGHEVIGNIHDNPELLKENK